MISINDNSCSEPNNYSTLSKNSNGESLIADIKKKKMKELKNFFIFQLILVMLDIIAIIISPNFLFTLFNLIIKILFSVLIIIILYILKRIQKLSLLKKIYILIFLFVFIFLVNIGVLIYKKVIINFYGLLNYFGSGNQNKVTIFYFCCLLYSTLNLTFPITGVILLRKTIKIMEKMEKKFNKKDSPIEVV